MKPPKFESGKYQWVAADSIVTESKKPSDEDAKAFADF